VGRIEGAVAQVVLVGKLPIHGCCVTSHRAVDIDRKIGDAVGALEQLQEIDKLLRPAHGERSHEHHAASLDRTVDDLFQTVK
jgi:hypothetical protein